MGELVGEPDHEGMRLGEREELMPGCPESEGDNCSDDQEAQFEFDLSCFHLYSFDPVAQQGEFITDAN